MKLEFTSSKHSFWAERFLILRRWIFSRSKADEYSSALEMKMVFKSTFSLLIVKLFFFSFVENQLFHGEAQPPNPIEGA